MYPSYKAIEEDNLKIATQNEAARLANEEIERENERRRKINEIIEQEEGSLNPRDDVTIVGMELHTE